MDINTVAKNKKKHFKKYQQTVKRDKIVTQESLIKKN